MVGTYVPQGPGQRPYHEGVSRKTVEGFVCLTCRRFWGDDERMAHWCCAFDVPCEGADCKAMASKPYVLCEACRSKAEEDRWQKRERRAWDGKATLYSDTFDRYWFGEHALEEFDEWAWDSCEDRMPVPPLPWTEKDARRAREAARLILCTPNYAREIDLSDLFSDDLPEDGDDVFGPVEPELRALNMALKALPPLSWTPSRFAVDLEKLPAPETRP